MGVWRKKKVDERGVTIRSWSRIVETEEEEGVRDKRGVGSMVMDKRLTSSRSGWVDESNLGRKKRREKFEGDD